MEKVTEIVRIKQITTEIELPFKKVSSSFGVAQWLQDEIGNETQEVLALFCLNTKNEVVCYSQVFRGTNYSSVAHPRDIYQRAILSNATHILIAHNHPSGHTEPSENDKIFTEKLNRAGEYIGIDLLDHIIVSTKSYYSFREDNGIL